MKRRVTFRQAREWLGDALLTVAGMIVMEVLPLLWFILAVLGVFLGH